MAISKEGEKAQGSRGDINLGMPVRRGGTTNLNTLIDPGDLLGRRGAKAAQDAAKMQAMQIEISTLLNTQKDYLRSINMLKPFMDAGKAAVTRLGNELGQDSPLVAAHRDFGISQFSDEADRLGFDTAETGAGLSDLSTKHGIIEEKASFGRLKDITDLSAFGTAQGAGRATQLSGNLAQTTLSGAANQAQSVINRQNIRDRTIATGVSALGTAFNERPAANLNRGPQAGTDFLIGESEESFR